MRKEAGPACGCTWCRHGHASCLPRKFVGWFDTAGQRKLRLMPLSPAQCSPAMATSSARAVGSGSVRRIAAMFVAVACLVVPAGAEAADPKELASCEQSPACMRSRAAAQWARLQRTYNRSVMRQEHRADAMANRLYFLRTCKIFHVPKIHQISAELHNISRNSEIYGDLSRK